MDKVSTRGRQPGPAPQSHTGKTTSPPHTCRQPLNALTNTSPRSRSPFSPRAPMGRLADQPWQKEGITPQEMDGVRGDGTVEIIVHQF